MRLSLHGFHAAVREGGWDVRCCVLGGSHYSQAV